jgi:hypothetical protein
LVARVWRGDPDAFHGFQPIKHWVRLPISHTGLWSVSLSDSKKTALPDNTATALYDVLKSNRSTARPMENATSHCTNVSRSMSQQPKYEQLFGSQQLSKKGKPFKINKVIAHLAVHLLLYDLK